MNMDALIADLTRDEGVRLKPYLDTVGKTTIGVGRNLTDVGISEDEADYLLHSDIARTVADLNRKLTWWSTLDEVRQRVLCNLCFNLGINGLLTFHNTLEAVRSGRYGDAADGMLASLWARQVGPRSLRLAAMMRTGTDTKETT
jgi:lysozyme